jgi:methionyl-tRNA synthetase
MAKTVYLTTPLYYVNAAPHIGHSYTNVAADCLARYYRLKGGAVFLLTGTDEHGQKIEQAATAASLPPAVFVDQVVERFKALWKTLHISYDDFLRTTEPRHTRIVQAVLVKLHQDGKLINAAYQGWYCTPDETFWTEAELGQEPRGVQNPVCPSCQRPLEPVTEEGWHVPLRASQSWLTAFVKSHPRFVQPASRYNELASLLEQPLPESLCITRPARRVSWGIPVPFSDAHVTYVWFDALLNYITVPGYLSDAARFATLWPADIHFIGKDILRHHAVYWPIILHTLGLPDEQMPQTIFAHGWWKVGEQKMSKSLGNIVDPTVVVGELLKDQPYAADVYRYFLLREVPFGQDGSFSEDAIAKRLASDLANDLGNLVNRTLSMMVRYCEGRIPALPAVGCAVDDAPLQGAVTALPQLVDEAMTRVAFSEALEAIMRVVTRANQFIEATAPWKLAKRPDDRKRLETVLALLAEVIRVVTILLESFMPSVAEAIWQQLGCAPASRTLSEARRWPGLTARQPIGQLKVLFPKTEMVAS